MRELTAPPRTPGNESALQLLCNLGKGTRPKCLLKNALHCHSERSEESWLSFNNIESDKSTPKRCFKQGCHSERSETAPPVIPSASEESWLDLNLTESDETAAAFTSAPFFLEGKNKKGETVHRQFHPESSYHLHITCQVIF